MAQPASSAPTSRSSNSLLALLPVLLTAIAICLDACAPKHSSYSSFVSVPADGWSKTLVLVFKPECADSLARYDVRLAVRHTSAYKYGNLSMAVDIVDSRGSAVRKMVNFRVADSYGNWVGSGFGSLYQCSAVVARGLTPAQMRSIAVWQTMSGCDLVAGVADVGVIISPSGAR